jgi:hypothetical protein
MSGGHCWRKTYPSFVLPLETHIWRLCIQPGKEEPLRTQLLNSPFPFDDDNLSLMHVLQVLRWPFLAYIHVLWSGECWGKSEVLLTWTSLWIVWRSFQECK